MDIIKKYSADSLRLFLISQASSESDFNWSDKGIQSSFKLINKMVEYFDEVKIGKSSAIVESKMNKAIIEITRDIESLKYNLAIIKLRQLFEKLEQEISKKDVESFLKLLNPFCPHITEELWEKLGSKGFVSLADWPIADESKINKNLERQEELNNKLITDINNILKIIRDKGNTPKKIYIYCIPPELITYNKEDIRNKINLDIEVFATNDKDKHDPSGISKKAKPGKPGIFVE